MTDSARMDAGGLLGIVTAGRRTVREIAAHSRDALDRQLRRPAELWVAVATDAAVLLGAFQRAAGTTDLARLLRRGSGGPAVTVARGTVHVALALSHPGAVVPCDERRIVNRAVRPLLRALTRSGAHAHFFGSDWVSVGHRPAAWVGFAHDATTRRTLFEAFVAVHAPFAPAGRAAFRGKTPVTLEEAAATGVDSDRVAEAIVAAYAAAYDPQATSLPAAEADRQPRSVEPQQDPPWTATCEEAIGTIGAGPDAHGVLRVGGDLLVSRDALARLEARAAAGDDPGRAVDETLGAPGVALDGVRSLASVRDVIARVRCGG